MPFTFEPSTDYELIRQILVVPACFRRMVNDSAPPPEDFQVIQDPAVRYFLIREDGRPAGMFLLFSPGTLQEAEIHFCFLPEVWGRSVEVGKALLEWVWENTEVQVLIGPVPSYNRLALKLAKAVGFTEWQTVPSGKTRRGMPFDLILMRCERVNDPGDRHSVDN